MKILSAYKDYYDYLVGVYGEDPILVLDRRTHTQPFDLGASALTRYNDDNEIKKQILWIGDYCIEFMSHNGIPYYGEDIKNIPGVKVKDVDDIHRWWISSYESRYNMKWDDLVKNGLLEVSWLGYPRKNNSVDILPYPTKRKRPEFLDDSIVIALGSFSNKNSYGDYIYPILSNLNLNKFVSPEKVYQMIVEYLSKRKLEAEYHVDTRTDTQRLEGKGFDKKTSFRPNIKK
jgi:hypothetical protein